MIIVSQDKEIIVNFDNVEMLGINPNCKSEIFCTFNEDAAKIGEYKTEERAKEILQEIIKASVGKLMIQVQANLPDEELIELNKKHGQEVFYYDLKTEIKQMTNTIIYRMPKE